MVDASPITYLLEKLKSGDNSALDELVPLVYPELRRMARSYLRSERPDHTLQPTALVHEAYLRLAGRSAGIESRAQFYGIASQLMRQILVDNARRKKAAKRATRGTTVTYHEDLPARDSSAAIVTAVDDALRTLGKHDPLKERLIELRFFGGLTAEESAETVGLPVQTVRRQLRLAQAWLQRELSIAG